MQQTDVVVIGAGIVGLATAYQLTQQFPEKRVIVLEKEREVAQHQTGRNSGVLHSGIYYKPGSLKAINCREGKAALEAFCEAEGINYDICGKVIVATQEEELPALVRIYERGQANGVRCEHIDVARLKELEPHVAGIAAIHVPEAGIVNYRAVGRRLAERIQERGGQIVTQAAVQGVVLNRGKVVVQSKAGAVEAGYMVNCAGLYADKIAILSGMKPKVKIIPFRGEYFELKPEVHHLCQGLIYPVPNPSFPFLGVHFTRMIEGGIECGPNAVLAFAREGYTKSIIHLGELVETLTYSGFIKLAAKYWQTGFGEMYRSFSKPAFVRTLQRLIPEICTKHLVPAPAGVRAQAIDPSGQMVDDFQIEETERMLHLINAPSPAATAALNIGKLLVEKLASRFV